MACLKCGGTGITLSGEMCNCGAAKESISIPLCLTIPTQYQGVKFDRALLPKTCPADYGYFMEKLLHECTDGFGKVHKNVLICSPPNTGKTVFAYTVHSILFGKGIEVPELKDIMEVRELFMDYYHPDREQAELVSKAALMFIKIPLDLPNKLAETMSTIVERRVRNNCITIFLYGGTKEDLVAQDRFGKFQQLIGDGSFNSIEVHSWK